MILYDKPRYIIFRGQKRLACHCCADNLETLHQFMLEINVPERAFHNKVNRPHYDLFDDAIQRAKDAGAKEVTSKELIDFLKKHYET